MEGFTPKGKDEDGDKDRHKPMSGAKTLVVPSIA
jgi:hypothetical protein